MTIHLAVDYIGPQNDFPDGKIVGIARTVAALRTEGFDNPPYTGNRLPSIDEAANPEKWDADCVTGWYFVGGAVQKARPAQFSETVANDIRRFKAAVDREALDVEAMLAREAFSPHTDSGHLWSDDVLHAIAKPHVRLLQTLLAAAKASPSQPTVDAYSAQLAVFVATAENPGLLGIYTGADKSVWRPLRGGTTAYGYDTATGGIRQVNTQDVAFPVSYPDGETVATWDALAAVEAL